ATIANIFRVKAVIEFGERPPAQGSSYSGRWPSQYLGENWQRSERERSIAFGRAAWLAGRRRLRSLRISLAQMKWARASGPPDRSGVSPPLPRSPASP